jgi:hypothetical protein
MHFVHANILGCSRRIISDGELDAALFRFEQGLSR